jgi:hypothetical protein
MATDPGNTLSTAAPFPIGRRNRTVRDSLSSSDRLDIWSFNITKRSYLNVKLNRFAKKAKDELFVLDSSGQTIEFLDNSGGRVGQLNNVLLEQGTFYVAVQLQQGSQDTRYALTLSAAPTLDKVGNSVGTATAIPIPSVTSRSTFTAKDFVGNDDPLDVFKFSMPTAGKFKLDLTGLSEDANLALYRVDNNNLKLVKASSSQGASSESITRSLNNIIGSPFYIAITPRLGSNTNYTFRYSFVPDSPTTTPSGLKYINLKPGKGPVPQPGQTVTVQYTGVLQDGTVFDSSRDNNQPFSFKLGAGEVIKGWDEAFTTMPLGSRRELIIPPDLAYGASGRGSIPPNATLIFDVEVVGIS